MLSIFAFTQVQTFTFLLLLTRLIMSADKQLSFPHCHARLHGNRIKQYTKWSHVLDKISK